VFQTSTADNPFIEPFSKAAAGYAPTIEHPTN